MIETIRNETVAVLMSVPDVGRVHDYQRFASNPSDLKNYYLTDQGKLCGWYIERTQKTEEHLGNRRYNVQNHIRIQGYMSWSDEFASQLSFDNLIESISSAFRNSTQFAKHSIVVHGINLVNAQPVMFCGVLCHSAELELITQHRR